MPNFGARFVWLAASSVLVACAPPGTTSSVDERPLVVATTTMLTDLVRELGGELVLARGIMSPGGDPHLYQPTPADARLLARSALVVTSGLGLEGWIDDLVRNAGGVRPIVVASADVAPLAAHGGKQAFDPHYWFDAKAYASAVPHVARALATLMDTDAERERIAARASAYEATLMRLDAWVRDQLAALPAERRVLVTSHDAFGYFGRAYGVEVVGIQGISTEAEASQRDLVRVIELVRARRLPAIFVETSVNPALIARVARETGVKVAGPLYSDSLGARDSAASTYVGMMAENVRAIVTALGGKPAPLVLGSASAVSSW